jgi:dipeptidyl aminopeptidase/acylaminoacyl peptidase
LLLSTRHNIYSRGIQLYGGSVIDWLPDQDGMVLMDRVWVPDDHLGSRAGSSKSGLSVEKIDTKTAKGTIVEQPNDDVSRYISDGQGTIRIKGEEQSGPSEQLKGVRQYYYRTAGDRAWKPLATYNWMTEQGFYPVAIDYERDSAYGFDKKDGRKAVYRLSLDGAMQRDLVLERPDVDVDGLYFLGPRRRVIGASYATDIRHVVYFDPEVQKLTTALGKALPEQPLVQIVDSSTDESRLLIWAGSDNDPGAYYIYDKKLHTLDTIGVVRPPLEGQKLAHVQAITYRASDGTMVPAYLTMPNGPAKNLPAIVLPHGGPSARDEWGFDWLSQFYAARGFAVIQPQFRGSSGYGDAWFQKNGFQSWKVAIGDVLDAGRWLVSQGIADKAKLAIVGLSYGGYAALQSAVTDPSLFKAVVAIAPVTDLAALKEESRGWTDFQLTRDFIGSGPHIREGSPAQNADRIKVPVLLFHAENDRNVRIAESRLMDNKLKAAGVPHELVTWPSLDHYLVDSDARETMLRKSEAFLRTAMGM